MEKAYSNSKNVTVENVTLVEMPNGKGLVTLDKCHPEQSVRALHTIIKNLLVLQQGANDGCDLSANMARAVVAQINHMVECGIKEQVEQVEDVVEFLEDEVECAVVEQLEEEIKTVTPTVWVKPAHHRIVSLHGMNRFDDATNYIYGHILEQRYCEWIDAGRPAVEDWVKSAAGKRFEVSGKDEVESEAVEQLEAPQKDEVESVCSEQFEVDFVEDDEFTEDDLKRECLSMLQKLSWIQPLHSLELEINYVHNLFSEWDYMREQCAKDRGTQLHKEMTDYLDNMETCDNLQAEIMEVGFMFMAVECMKSKDDIYEPTFC